MKTEKYYGRFAIYLIYLIILPGTVLLKTFDEIDRSMKL